MRRLLLIMFCTLAAHAHASGFSFTRTDSRIVVDTGANLLFSVDTRNGDLTSMRYRDSELQTTEPKASQLASGLGSAQVNAHTVDDVVVISARAGDLIQYYLAKKGRNAVYLATYAPTLPPAGELRFVARLNVNKLPKADHGTDSNVGTAIEGKDVFLLPDGRTSSKFYSAQPMFRDSLHGVKGLGVAVYMLMGNHELSSGGPFFKDVATQKTPVTHELYNYMFSNHTQTEAYRGGLHGVYGLLFTDGGAPSSTLTDLGFVNDALGLAGFLDNTERGTVAGQVSGVVSALPAVVGLSNAEAEYWAPVDSSGRFQITAVRAGHYRMTLYQKELEMAQSTVEVRVGNTQQASLQAQPPEGRVKWQIGVPDGTPNGFHNASLLSSAHPSDARMAPWVPVIYNVGSSQPDDFPAAQWRDINTPTRINFVLGTDEVRDYRLRLFISLAQAGGRPRVSVNQRWNAPIPPATNQPDSRGITRGTYRGNNSLFEVSVPAAALHPGANSLEIDVASGQASSGFLSPGFVFDSVQWVLE